MVCAILLLMPTISAKVIRSPRKQWKCEMCSILIEGVHLRMYGMAEIGDLPYVVRSCFKCSEHMIADKKVKAALKEIV